MKSTSWTLMEGIYKDSLKIAMMTSLPRGPPMVNGLPFILLGV